jgi:thiol peroxidase
MGWRKYFIELCITLLAVGIVSVTFSGCKENLMNERKGVITMKGKPLTLQGRQIKVGDEAPDAEVVANDLSVVKLSSYRGKVCIIASVPSLDTSVCDTETHRFNEEAAKLGDNVVVLTISMDLPFAQKRWCGAAGIKNVTTLSDYRYASFGEAYGVLIKELRLLARAVFVVDKSGVVRYVQVVPEVAKEPDYDSALKAAKGL